MTVESTCMASPTCQFKYVACFKGTKWTKISTLNGSATAWYPQEDKLSGNPHPQIGRQGDPEGFYAPIDKSLFDKFLFISGGRKYWMIIDYAEIYDG
jgi:hypothetical protein